MVSQPAPERGVRSPCAPNRAPFPYEHRLPSWVENLVVNRRKSRRRRKGDWPHANRDVGVTSTDLDVLRRMLKWRTIYPDSCWVDRATLGRQLGLSEKTITRAWRRLERVGALCSDQYGERGDPDPREPLNTTGWRHWFPFVRERLRQGRAPDRRPNHERHRRRRGDNLSPVGGDILSPNGSLSTPSELRNETTDDPPARAFEAGTATPEPDSSSSFASPPKLRIHHAEQDEPGTEASELAELLELAELRFPGVRDDRGLLQRTETEAAQHGPGFGDRWRKALEYVEIRDRTADPIRNFVGFLAIVRNWRHRSLEAIDRDLADERKRHPPKIAPTPPPAEPDNRQAEQEARQAELRAAWERLPESERDSILAAVKAENPGLVRWPTMIAACCLAALEKRPCDP